jgi:hypothetical protein
MGEMADMGKRGDGRLRDNPPERLAERDADYKSRDNADDAAHEPAAQLLQMLHEGHAQHALLFRTVTIIVV